MAIFEQKPFTR